MADKVTVQVGNVDEQAYTALVAALKAAKKADSHLKKARAEQDGVYNSCMAACSTLKSLADANATLDAVSHDIWFNVDGLAVATGAEKREEVSADGKKYKLPAAFSTVKSVIIFAFENEVSMIKTDDKGKPITNEEGKPAVKSFTELRKEKSAILDTRKKAEVQKQVAALTGIAKLRHDLQVLMAEVSESVSTWTSEDEIRALMLNLQPYKPKSQAEKLHAANEAAKRSQRAERKGRKHAAKGAKDVAEDLSEAA